MASLFISDLHLAPERPRCARTLLTFLGETAVNAEELFILGDLFDYWIGDEALDEAMPAQVAASLRELADSGTKIHFMHGNRDFLVGKRFSEASGAQLLPDPFLFTLYGVPTLLMHGDTLCTDDVDYLKFRERVRNPQWQSEFLAKPVSDRVAYARSVRAESEHAKREKPMTIMDVSPAAVESVLRTHGYPRLIHGHTHRPATHRHVVDGHCCERFVLADWYEQGSYLMCDKDGCRSMPVT